MAITPELKLKLQTLADKYETSSFCNEDPSQFLRWYPVSKTADVECASFIAAMIAFGNRKQFIPKIRLILETADKTSGSITKWLLSGAKNFPHGQQKFYRFYSYDDLHNLFGELAQILNKAPTLGDFFSRMIKESKTPTPALHSLVADAFPTSAIVPKGKASANKRVHMFLRWMVRKNSCVDLGLWDWYSPERLIMPLDVHVMEEGKKLGLLPDNAKPTYKTALLLTEQMSDIFKGDPVRADFALFGLGVDSKTRSD